MAGTLQAATFPMNVQDIERYIPHRYPFLLLDRVTECIPYKSIKAHKNISSTDPILQGHFPGNPVFPGVLQVEALAQASAVLAKLSAHEKATSCLLLEINNTRFRRMVVPGDVLTLQVELIKQRGGFIWFKGEAFVEQELTAAAEFSAKIS